MYRMFKNLIPVLGGLMLISYQTAMAQVKTATRITLAKQISSTSPITARDLISGKFKDLNIYSKVAMLSRVPGKTPAGTAGTKTATVNGVTYTLQKTPFTTGGGEANIGAATTLQSPDGLKVCAVQKAKSENVFDVLNQFTTQSQVFVGGIYADESVLRGTYARMNLPRNPMQITTELVDFTQNSPVSNIETVASPENTGQINQAIANLLRRNQNASVPGNIRSDVFEVHSAAQLSVNLSSNASANLEPLLGVPVTVGTSQDIVGDTKFEFNQVAAVVVQPFFNISVATPPTQLINGAAPANAVYVSNVVYGRIAIITAISTVASTSLQADMSAAVDAVDVVSAENGLSAGARALFEARAIKVYIFGGDPVLASGVAVGSFAEFKNYINGMKAGVSGALGVPIAYQLRYIADDAPVNMKAVTEFNAVECKKASQIRASLTSIKVTNVVDFGFDEELFGNVKVGFGGKDYTLWSVSAGNAIKKGKDQVISASGDEEFINVFPDQITNNTMLTIKMNVKDKIEGGPEFLGAAQQAKDDGFVTYTPGSVSVKALDIINANGGLLTRTFTLTEGSAEIKVTVRFKVE
jgi:hypothetical protein